jgi:hypothetical protein
MSEFHQSVLQVVILASDSLLNDRLRDREKSLNSEAYSIPIGLRCLLFIEACVISLRYELAAQIHQGGLEETYRDALAAPPRPGRGLEVVELPQATSGK